MGCIQSAVPQPLGSPPFCGNENMRPHYLPSHIGRLAIFLSLLGLTLALTAAPATQAQIPTTVNWPYSGNDLANTRYQAVDQITPANVAQLQPAWVFHTGVLDDKSSFEVSPIVIDGTMYISTGHDDVFALDAATGAEKWAYHPLDERPPLEQISICCGRDSRGVAYGNGKVFLGRLDAVLVALDATTGEVVWKTTVADWHDDVSIPMAPQFVNGKVLVSVSGASSRSRAGLPSTPPSTEISTFAIVRTVAGSET